MELAPPDPILNLTIDFNNDPRPTKVNLSVGAYRNAEGKPQTLSTVRKAEARIYEKEPSKEYLPIDGLGSMNEALLRLLFGPHETRINHGEIVAMQAVGGTGALRICAELMKNKITNTIFVSDPTWTNHYGIFQAAGFTVETYPYYNYEDHSLKFEAMIETLEELPAKSAILFHACCHNPTGVDPTPEQWKQICQVVKKRELFPIFDCAYQGYGQGLTQDAFAVRHFAEQGVEFLVTVSCAKNFGLYAERVGMIGIVANNANAAAKTLSQGKKLIRAMYSNPPLHGAKIISTILNSDILRGEWKQEVGNMRDRIQEMRNSLGSILIAKTGHDYSYVTREYGMFSFTGLSESQVARLREESAIFMLKSGRINVAGLNWQNMEYVTDAIARVLRG